MNLLRKGLISNEAFDSFKSACLEEPADPTRISNENLIVGPYIMEQGHVILPYTKATVTEYNPSTRYYL